MDSAARIPDFTAVCVPLIFGTFKKPAEHPTSIPPGKYNLGIDWYPPSFKALAAYEIHFPPSNVSL